MLDTWLSNKSLQEAMQKSSHQDAKLHLLECKVATIVVQSNTHHGVKLQLLGCDSKYFRFQLGISPNH